MIMKGMVLLSIYLNEGVSGYVEWSHTAGSPKTP
jgi:hypothetical protein